MKRRHLLWYSLWLLTGCTAATTVSPSSSVSPSPTVRLKTLRFAVSDVKGLEDLKKDYEALRMVLEQALETPIEFFPVDSYVEAASALRQDQVDLVFTGPSEYVVMRARTNAVPLVAIQRARYYPVFVTLANSGLKKLTDLKGKTIAMWEVASTSGYLGPTKMLIDAGLDPKVDVKIELLGKKGLPSLKAGEVDVWAGSIRRYDKFLETEKLTENDLPIIAQGQPFPADPFVANSKLGPELIAQLKERLIQRQAEILKAIAPADGNKFEGATMVAVNDEDFNGIRDAYKATGQGSFL